MSMSEKDLEQLIWTVLAMDRLPADFRCFLCPVDKNYCAEMDNDQVCPAFIAHAVFNDRLDAVYRAVVESDLLTEIVTGKKQPEPTLKESKQTFFNMLNDEEKFIKWCNDSIK